MRFGFYEFRKKATWLIFAITNIVFILWFAYILKGLYAAELQEKLGGVSRALIQFSLALAAAAVLFGFYKLMKTLALQKIIHHRFFPLLIFAVALLPRVAWIFIFSPVKPFSDFELYMTLGSSIAATGHVPDYLKWYITYAPYVLGYAGMLAFLFTIFGQSIITAMAANAIFSSLIAVLLFMIGKKITGKPEIGVLAAGLIIVLPSQMAMTIFPGTELPYIALMMATFYICLIIPNHPSQTPRYAMVMFAAVVTVLMNEIRPLGILILASFCAYFVLSNRFTRKSLVQNAAIIALFVVVYYFSSSALYALKDEFLGMPVARNAYGFGLYLGLNYETVGHWGLQDAALVGKAESKGEPAQQFHQNMVELAIQRFKELYLTHTLIDLLAKKISIFWTNPNIFINWTPLMTKITATDTRILKGSYLASKALYSLVIFLSLVEAAFAFLRRDFAYLSRSFFIKIMLLATLAMHSVFDINERYVSPAIPLLILLGAFGFQSAANLFSQQPRLLLQKLRTNSSLD